MRLALGMTSVFVWLFLFEFFVLLSMQPTRALLAVAIIYAVSQSVSIFLTPISAAHLRRGVRRMMVAGALVLAAAFVVLGAVLAGVLASAPTLWGILLFAFLFGAYRALYWTPYRIQEELHGEPVSFVFEVIVALMPALAGATVASTALGSLQVLFAASTFLLLSLLPAYALPDTREEFSWHYSETFRELFASRHRMLLVHGMFDGIQGAALFLVWPLAVFLIVNASYLTLGVVMSATLLLLFAFRRPVQALSSRWQLQDSSTVHITLAVSGWLLRIAVGTPLGIIFADSYSYLGEPRGRTVAVSAFDQAADSASFIDEYSALKELALALGRTSMGIAFGFLLLVLPLPAAIAMALAIAAISSGAAVYVSHKINIAF